MFVKTYYSYLALPNWFVRIGWFFWLIILDGQGSGYRSQIAGSSPAWATIHYTIYIFTTMDNNKSSSGGGIGFFRLLAIVFITLKLCAVINWSWWWVLAPLWMPVALIIIIGMAYIVYKVIKD